MAEIYTASNLSGSAGKTTTVVTAAVSLAEVGYRVRVVDFDPQGNASTLLGYPEHAGPSIADACRQQVSVADVELPARVLDHLDEETGVPIYGDDPDDLIPNLTIVPASYGPLTQLQVELSAITGGVMRLREALEASDPVDITLIDAPGNNSSLVQAAIIASSVLEDDPNSVWGVITCTKPAGKENEGIQKLIALLADIKRVYRIEIPLRAIVPTIVTARATSHNDGLGFLREAFGDLVTPPVRNSTIVDEAYTNYMPLPYYGYRANPVVDDYIAVVKHMKDIGMFNTPRVSPASRHVTSDV